MAIRPYGRGTIGRVVKVNGKLTHKIIGKPFTAQGDRYAKLCKM